MMSDCPTPLKTMSSPLCARGGAGHITLESLLDSPGLTPPSPLSESMNDSCLPENGALQPRNPLHLTHHNAHNLTEGHNTGIISINEQQRLVFLRDVCVELLCVLRSQDINGYFLSSVSALGVGKVGQLKSGSCLLPNGGYREDRRNKVIPYTYLDYGPYYSFAPRFDSGASHCSPEANQLILSTSWLPARTAFLTVKPKLPKSTSTDELPEGTPDPDEITQAIQTAAVCSALEAGDHQLAVSLAVIEMENQATSKLSAELDQILPGPEVDDDCVYGLCLANALTRDLLSAETSQSAKDTLEDLEHSSVDPSESVTCDLDQQKPPSDEIPDDCPVPSCVENELADSATELRALYRAQYRRLGDTSQIAATSGSTLYPSSSEVAIAHRLVGRLVDLTKRARPRDLVHPYALRRAMGMKPDMYALPDELDNDGDLEIYPRKTNVLTQ
ncbi:unnamed protein product [Echinostoma caproni]|uniref:FERM and PDZ domain-containing protein 2 n=1 Tax=Echinostoma caproni TaxID=27848 RepID=A0A183AWZ3_9TREM|nr:unnamed protein product [Echinostoma caproni]